MAYFFQEPSHTFSEYLLVPGYSSEHCIPANVSLKTPVVRFKKGEECPLTMNVPMVSAVMQAVSGEQMGIALAKEGGIAFIYVSQSIESQAAMVRRVKNYKAGFVISDSNLRVTDTLADVLALKQRTGHSTMAVTDDGTGTGKLLGLVTSRDYRVSRMDPDAKVADFMTPVEKLIYAPEGTSLKTANDIIWDHKLNALPIISEDGHLVSFVFRKDYDSHKGNPLELLDSQKRYVVGAGINTRDYEERVPALVEAGADEVVRPELEGGIELLRHTLIDLGYRPKQISGCVERLRESGYEALGETSRTKRIQAFERMVSTMSDIDIQWASVGEGAAGKSLSQLDVRGRTGAQAVALRRAGSVQPFVNPAAPLQVGDVLGLMGTVEQTEAAEHLLA